VVHVSSLSVLAGRSVEEVLDAPPLTADPGGYTATKWAADRRVAEALRRGVRGVLARTGRLGPDAAGRGNEVDLLIRTLRVVRRLGVAPERRHAVRLLPVDEAARALVRLAGSDVGLGRAVHLAGAEPLAWPAVLEAAAPGVRLLPRERWLDLVRSLAEHEPQAAPVLLACAAPDWDRPDVTALGGLREVTGSNGGGHATAALARLRRWHEGTSLALAVEHAL
jgi:nucleoside-diphosphate-sugar epimerase